jgi:hypothetical protein
VAFFLSVTRLPDFPGIADCMALRGRPTTIERLHRWKITQGDIPGKETTNGQPQKASWQEAVVSRAG